LRPDVPFGYFRAKPYRGSDGVRPNDRVLGFFDTRLVLLAMFMFRLGRFGIQGDIAKRGACYLVRYRPLLILYFRSIGLPERIVFVHYRKHNTYCLVS
jgi:hypothetical protein